MKLKAIALAAGAFAATLSLGACQPASDVASRNLSQAADNFEIMRRVVFYNGITDTYMLTIEGLCSIEPVGGRLEVTCQTGPDRFVKHFLGLSDNVTYIAEQLEGVDVSTYHNRVAFRPQTIVPNIDLMGDTDELFTRDPN
jgi:hypothetical protein